MFLIRDNQKDWIFTNRQGFDNYISKIYNHTSSIELETLHELIESRTYEIQEGELVYIIKEKQYK